MLIDGNGASRTAAAPPPPPPPPPSQQARTLLAQHRQPGGYDMPGLAAAVRASDQPAAARAETVLAIEAQLTPVQRGQFAASLDAAVRTPTPTPGPTPTPVRTPVQAAHAPAPSAGPDPVQLGLDLGQMALDLTGIVDPTPISDGANAVVSVGRSIGSLFSGDWSGAGGHLANAGISVVSVLPGLGDLAKAGKIGKWAQTVADGVSAVAHNPALRASMEPTLRTIHDAVGKIPQGALDKLPAGARDSLVSMKRQLDEFFAGGAQATTRAGVQSAKVGTNSVEWTVDASGRPTRVSATLSELQPSGTARGRAELDAQDATRGRGLADDDAGHVIGHRFLGDQGARNMFPQNFNFNRSAYKTMENEWAAWIDKGGTVKVDVELIGGTGGRPAEVGVSYEVFNAGGKRVFDNQEMFANAANQVFDRVPTGDMSRILGQ